MAKGKSIRERGKIKFSEYFKLLKEGDKVAVVKEKSSIASFPKRIHGRTGTIVGKRGRSYLINLKELNKDKIFIIQPIHLKKIKSRDKND
ncbi:MAG: 50S ribosomal protein L21e [Candidatus Pacearchaeota archaeon]